MVKITNPDQPKTKPIQNNAKFVMKDPTTKETKHERINLRLTPAITDQLRAYSEEHKVPITRIVEEMVMEKFHNKKIDRNYYNLTEPATILLPNNQTLLTMYVADKINMVAEVNETSRGAYNIHPFDKQAHIFNKYPNELSLIQIQQVNNALDSYDSEQECYYSTYKLPNGADKYLNHMGLITIPTLLPEEEENQASVEDFILLVKVHIYDGILLEAEIITDEEAIIEAKEVDNEMLISYLENIENVAQIVEISEIMETMENQTLIIKKLEKSNAEFYLREEEYKTEIKKLKELTNIGMKGTIESYYNSKIKKLEKENKELNDQLNNIDQYVNECISEKMDEIKQKILFEARIQMNNTLLSLEDKIGTIDRKKNNQE